MQFQAAFIIDVVAKQITNFEAKDGIDKYNSDVLKIRGLLKHLSSFDVDFNEYFENFKYKELNSFLATLNNIITRGLPTRAPVLIEEKIAEILKVIKRNDEKKSEIQFVENNYNIDWQTIFELLHIVEPNLNITRDKYIADLGSEGEWNFINNQLQAYPFVKQILQSQRQFSTITKALPAGYSVDFSYEIPYLKPKFEMDGDKEYFEQFITKGVILEYDGQHHKLASYKTYDKFRNEEADEANFETLRQPSDSKILLADEIVQHFDKYNFYKIFNKNYNTEIRERIEEYILIFTPIAVARIQKTLIEYFLRKPELLEKKILKIGIIERDVPCGALAIKSFQEYVANLKALIKDDFKFPELDVSIFADERFNKYNLHLGNESQKDFNENDFDILIDHSILRRSGLYDDKTFSSAKSIIIRSCHFVEASFGKARRTYCANPLNYKVLVTKQPDGTYKANELENNINFFIQNIFRKPSFKEGQLPIISRALSLLPVIGLLPTGGGKSLTFQLSALMQPGICIVVDPIKTLMEDQVRVLKNNWIDCCDYINSTLSRIPKRNKLYNFRFGESQIMFLSPERFVMVDFRNLVRNINSLFDLSITYCVIDEVHCVSEWGHNFRDTYLHLGRNAQNFCYTKNQTENNKVTLVGLTATASYDVLSDVERELNIQHTDLANALIMSENTIRPEMFYRVVETTNEKSKALQNDIENIGKNLQYWNDATLLKNSFETHQDNFNKDEKYPDGGYTISGDGNVKDLTSTYHNEHPAIIFCATKSNFEKLTPNSVCEVYTNFQSESKGYFFGGNTDDEIVNEAQENFEKFIRGKLKHIVATKAFGMGIDKEDVRVVYHINYSNSLESFVQESGRAGRDKKICESVVLINNGAEHKISDAIFTKENYDNLNYAFLRVADFRRNIRWNFIKELKADSKNSLEIMIDNTPLVAPAPNAKISIKDFLKKHIIENKPDRNTLEYFYENSFKGIDNEKSQIHDLFISTELNDTINLKELFIKSKNGDFEFVLLNSKTYFNKFENICNTLGIAPNPAITINFDKALKYSTGYFDFILKLEEYGFVDVGKLNETQFRNTKYQYARERNNEETGKLIYRMCCMGLIEDYTIDYVAKQRTCTFRKENIAYYVETIRRYFLKYLSEITTNEKILELEKRLDVKNELIDKIKECLYFLTEFSYKEIAGKQKRAIDDIEKVMTESLFHKDKYEQNHYIKDEIYYYFNAKYARLYYTINNVSYSLIQETDTGKISDWNLVEKYTIDIVKNELGSQVNTYKHLIGSCKKISRGMVKEEIEKEWSLKLIRAFACYSINTVSNIKEANQLLLEGFSIFYFQFCKQDYELFSHKFNSYFNYLATSLENEHRVLTHHLLLIKNEIMLDINNCNINKMINSHNTYLINYNGRN